MDSRRAWSDPTTEALSSGASSRSSDSNYLDQGETARPLRPPRPALLRKPEEREALPVAEEHGSISVGLGHYGPTASRPEEPPERSRQVQVEESRRSLPLPPQGVKGSVAAVGHVVQEQLQMKYGLSLDMDDFLRKVDSLCRAQLSGEDWDPWQVVNCFNSIKDMRFRSRDASKILALRLEPESVVFDRLLQEVRLMTGTSCAVAVVGRRPSAVAVFRESYGAPAFSALVGRGGAHAEPLVVFGPPEVQQALLLGVSVVEVLRHDAEKEALPALRAEYVSLRDKPGAKPPADLAVSAPPNTPELKSPVPVNLPPPPTEEHIDRQKSVRADSRLGLAEALRERRAAEAAQPSVVSMAMDWLWSGGGTSWSQSARQRTGSAPPSSQRSAATAPQYPKLAEISKLSVPKAPISPGRFSHRSRPPRQSDMPAPLLMAAGLGSATLSRADSPETPPAARMRCQDEAPEKGVTMERQEHVVKDAQRPFRKDREKSAPWGFCA